MMSDYTASPSTSALVDAANWIEGFVQGPIASSIAALAIAALGFSMLRGRLPIRRGLSAVVGCSILFGAPVIARGLTQLAVPNYHFDEPADADTVETPQMRTMPPSQIDRRVDTDPYGGA